MRIVMQLLIDSCEFPNNTSAREQLARKNCCAYSSARSALCQSSSRRRQCQSNRTIISMGKSVSDANSGSEMASPSVKANDDVHIDVNGLIRDNGERLRFRAETLRCAVLHV